MNIKRIIPIIPVPKPRMTRSDKWKKRPAVLRYRQFKDDLREDGIHHLASKLDIVFYVPMPKSWSAKKKSEMIATPHQQKPDIDNYIKALFDAVAKDDSYIYDVRARKLWAIQGSIVIEQDEQYNNTEKELTYGHI